MYSLLFSFFFFHQLLIVYCQNATTVQNKSFTVSTQPNNILSNKTKLQQIAEGGPLVTEDPEGPILNLSAKENQTSLLNLDQDFVKIKEKASHPRKGVKEEPNIEEIDSLHHINPTKETQVNKTNLHTNNKQPNKDPMVPAKVFPHKNDTVPLTKISNDNKSNDNTSTTSIHLKPTILSYEALVSMETSSMQTNHNGVQQLQINPKLLVQDQSSSDKEDNNIVLTKVRTSTSNGHPGLIMPVIITILVVPLFVVLGYMGLQRGREAWKNRHYKRMDFLLDGMYND